MIGLGSTTQQNLVSLFWIVFLLYWLVSAMNTKRYAKRSPAGWSMRLLLVVVILGFYSLPGIRHFLSETENAVPEQLQWFGVALSACGIAIAIWARVHLGRNWGMPASLKQDAELVRSGPYAYVRHPIYTGFMLAALGSSFVSVWWLLPFVLLSTYFVFAARAEEEIMVNEFPALYPDYMRRTKMLVPFVF